MRSPRVKPFKLYAGHPSLELVNTLDMRFSENPEELLPTYADLLRFTAQLRLITAEQARKLLRSVEAKEGQRILGSAVELREALATFLYAWTAGHRVAVGPVKTLEKYFVDAARHRSLRADKLQLGWSWAEAEQRAEIPLWKLAQAAADLLVSSDAERVKDCGDPGCRWLFLDLSKNHTRRWCDMKTCGNRMKARRFQARLQSS